MTCLKVSCWINIRETIQPHKEGKALNKSNQILGIKELQIVFRIEGIYERLSFNDDNTPVRDFSLDFHL